MHASLLLAFKGSKIEETYQVLFATAANGVYGKIIGFLVIDVIYLWDVSIKTCCFKRSSCGPIIIR